jgi:hypothetical protein
MNSGCCRRESGLTLREDEVQALQELGLTLSQAKVYMTLVTIGSSTAVCGGGCPLELQDKQYICGQTG